MDMTIEDLTAAMAKAVAEGLAAAEHERQQAEQRGTEDDPLTEERISAMVEEKVGARVEALEKAHEEKLAQAIADAKRVDPAAAKHGLGDVWPLPYDALVREPRDETEAAAQKVSDAMYVIGKFAEKPLDAAQLYLRAQGLEADNVVAKALDTYTATQGLEWVPTYFSAQMIADIDQAARVAPVFPRIPMAAKNVTMPGGGGIPVVYRTTGAENTDVTETTQPQSRNVEMVAEDLRAFRGFSDNIDQDSIISVASYLLSRLAYGFAYALDRAILDGDTDENGIDGVVPATSYLRAWDGLRKKCLTDTGGNVDLSAFIVDNLVQLPAGMDQYADDLANLIWIVPSRVYWNRLFTLKDAEGNPAFLPATGQSPAVNPVITGQVGVLLGIPVLTSGLMRRDLNASGQYDGSTTNKTIIHLVNRQAWVLGDRRQLTVETDKNIVAGTNRIVMNWRGDFQHLYGTALTTVMGYNVA